MLHRLMTSYGQRRLAETWIKDGREHVRVSTCRIDHPAYANREIWETMVFGGRLGGYLDRLPTRTMGKAMHNVTVIAVRVDIEHRAAQKARRRRMRSSYRARWA